MSDEPKPDNLLSFPFHILGPHESGGTIQIDAQQEGGPMISIPPKTMGLIRLAGTTVGWDAVVAIAALAATLQRSIDLPGVPMTDEEYRKLAVTFTALHATAATLSRDGVLEVTYELLRERKINRAQAAVLASDVLQKKVKTDTWRKAVDKWAADSGRPPIELPRGRPGKRNPEYSL